VLDPFRIHQFGGAGQQQLTKLGRLVLDAAEAF